MEDKIMLARINRTYPSFMDDFFGSDRYPTRYHNNGFKSLPAVNISEGENEFTVEVAAPGLEKKDFKIDLENDVLTIASVREDNKEDKKEETNDQYTRREFAYCNFSRSFNLPDSIDADNISAAHKNGILNVSIPKKEEAKAKPAKQIAVK
jgi:HSP20 family protein